MDKFKTIGVGGLGLVLDDFRWFFGRLTNPNDGMYEAFNNLLRGFGENFIVQGVVLSGSTGAFSITEGWVILDGELVKVDAQGPFDEANDSKFVKVTTFDSRGNKTFLNGAIEDTYEKNRAVIQGTSGNLDFDANTFFQLSNQADFRDDAPSEQGIVVLKKKIIEIGAWNMLSTANLTVAHGITGLDVTKVRPVSVMIDDPTSSGVRPLTKMNISFNIGEISGGVNLITATNVFLNRQSGGDFAIAQFQSTALNRGWITIEFET